jgi:hypothetical protein
MKRTVLLVGVLAIEVAMFVALIPSTRHDRLMATDFVNFYAAGTIVRAGNGATLYHAATQEPVLRSILGGESFNFFLHPPFFAAAMVPLSYLKIKSAFIVWTLFNLALVGFLPVILAECTSFVARRPILGLVGMSFFPLFTTLALGQSSIVLLFVLSMGYLLLTKRHDVAAGLVLALATIKFQYVLVIVGFLLIARKFRVVAGFAAGGAVLCLVSLLVTGPAGFAQYVRFVRDFNLHDGYGVMRLAEMVNWRGFLAGMGWIKHMQEYSAAGSAALLLLGIACSRSPRTAEHPDLAFSLYVAIALAASPYAFSHDAAILLLPIFLAMDSVVSGRIGGAGAKVLACASVLVFVWPIILLVVNGDDNWWHSRIYLVFPADLLFIAALAVELCPRKPISLESMTPTSI